METAPTGKTGTPLASGRLGQVAVVLVVAGLWELVTRSGLVDAQLLPPPSQVLARGWTLLVGGRLLPDLWASLWRVLVGFAGAALLAAPLGVALGMHPRLAALCSPLLSGLRPLSPPAWIPLAILWFGIGDAPALFIIFVGTFLTLVVGVMGAARAVDEELLNAARTLGASQGQMVRYVVLPLLAPALLTQARVGLGLAWMCVIAAEMVAVQRGLGFMMIEARNLFRTADVLAGMGVIAAVGVATDRGLAVIEGRVCRW
jgi:NitT/TauT family transport system permease protein